ncbi:MAG TPA: response regulator [Nitrospira sp.]|nr:response regulator [Nitrospira sp.]
MGLGRVLVVDDEPYLRECLRLILTRAGYEVIEAEDGEKGVAAITKSDKNVLLVDVIICDLHMPKMNGMEAIAYFRSQFPSVPVIVLTGEPDLQNAKKLKMEQGVMDYLVKPVQMEQILAVLQMTSLQKAVKGRVFFST